MAPVQAQEVGGTHQGIGQDLTVDVPDLSPVFCFVQPPHIGGGKVDIVVNKELLVHVQRFPDNVVHILVLPDKLEPAAHTDPLHLAAVFTVFRGFAQVLADLVAALEQQIAV